MARGRRASELESAARRVEYEYEYESASSATAHHTHAGRLPLDVDVSSPLGEPGRPLDPGTRAVHEAWLGWDLGSVRVHDGPAAWTWTRRLGARAATLGRHIALSRAESGSSSPAGQALLAHELTHVVQQGTGLSPVVPQRATPEGEADDVSAESASSGGGGLGPPIELSDGTTIQLLTTAATVEERIPPWAPHELRRAILDGTLAPGVHRFPGRSPWGDIVVQVSAQSSRTRIEMYQEFPSDMDFYTGVAQGRAGVAHILFDAYTAYNKDMAYFVEGKGLPPGEARDRLREINEEVFRLVIEPADHTMSSEAGQRHRLQPDGARRCGRTERLLLCPIETVGSDRRTAGRARHPLDGPGSTGPGPARGGRRRPEGAVVGQPNQGTARPASQGRHRSGVGLHSLRGQVAGTGHGKADVGGHAERCGLGAALSPPITDGEIVLTVSCRRLHCGDQLSCGSVREPQRSGRGAVGGGAARRPGAPGALSGWVRAVTAITDGAIGDFVRSSHLLDYTLRRVRADQAARRQHQDADCQLSQAPLRRPVSLERP